MSYIHGLLFLKIFSALKDEENVLV